MATSSSSKLLISLAVIGILGCLSVDFTGQWEINIKANPSTGSRFYVLHDWQSTYTSADDVGSFPASSLSDVMLKTMGILKDGVNWAGVAMGNLFSRPSATALFVVDGLSSKTSLQALSDHSYAVDQTGLTGCTCGDMKLMFAGNNVATHLSGLFDHASQTYSISANTYAAEAASAQDSFTSESQLMDMVNAVQKGEITLSDYDLEEASRLDISNKVDAHFIAELVLIQQAVQQLGELTSYVKDGAPDVYVFTISTLNSVEKRYGPGSSKAKLAAKLVRQTILKMSDQLVSLYNQRILVQALVLEWDYPEVAEDATELTTTFELLKPHIEIQDFDTFVASLPKVAIKETSFLSMELCGKLKTALDGTHYIAHCPTFSPPPLTVNKGTYFNRVVRQAPDDPQHSNVTVASISFVEDRSDNFAALFLITLFIMVSLGLAVFATSWAMWTMDPGRDSIIYRQVSDPTDGIQLK